MTGHFDALEARDPQQREGELFSRLPDVLAEVMLSAGYANHLVGVNPADVVSRAMLARLPLLRRSELESYRKASPPFGGFASPARDSFAPLSARAAFAAGFREGDLVLNMLRHHRSPRAVVFESGAEAIHCTVIPAGPNDPAGQLDLIAAFRPTGCFAAADALKALLRHADETGREIGALKRAQIPDEAATDALRADCARRGIEVFRSLVADEIGVVAYETSAHDGLVVNEGLIVEIVQAGTNRPAAEGEIGEVVVTSLDPLRPAVRLALGCLSLILPGPSRCGRTNLRLAPCIGSADQSADVNGTQVRSEQIGVVARRHPSLTRLRLVVSRAQGSDVMTLKAEVAAPDERLRKAVAATLANATKIDGRVEFVVPGSLPADGKVITDERA
jgi:phenylacetate-CoA ligase